jgi:hypothetical protein
MIGTYVVIDLPPVDPSALILMAPIVVIPGFAGALLRGRAVVAAIAAGAVAGPIGAMLAIAGSSCDSNMFAAIGLAAAAAYALVIAGLAAFAGERIGGSDWVECNLKRGVLLLVVVGVIGVIGWIPAVAKLGGGCP